MATSESALTPLAFLERSAYVWSDRLAVRDSAGGWTYGKHFDRVRRAAAALRSELGVAPGDRVATLLPNVSAMLEAHYAVPGVGAVLVPLNTRLAAAEYSYIIEHSGASVLIASCEFRDQVETALRALPGKPPRVVWVDAASSEDGAYECLVADATPSELERPADERALLSINYTSGTTGKPKGVMTTHRGAYLHTLGVIAESNLGPTSRYLWTLPMFHCNGWAYTWAITAAGGTHVCLPKIDPDEIWTLLIHHGISHFCAAPTVLIMLLSAAAASPCPRPVRVFVGGAPPAPALLDRAASLNLDITHLYGLTETYGPFAVCARSPEWDQLPSGDRARLMARQGVATIVSERIRIVDSNMCDVEPDGRTIGEVVMRGNNVMLGYYRDQDATTLAFTGGWFHSGDLGVMHPDGYIELRDRLKDVIICGGENIASIEVEQTLMEHALVSEAAVVGVTDERWGEVPVAYVTTLTPGELDVLKLRDFARARLAHFKVPKQIFVADSLPKTSTGKIQKYVLREQATADFHASATTNRQSSTSALSAPS